MNHSLSPCQRSIHIFHLPLHPRRTWPLLWLLHIPRNMKHWNYPTSHGNSHSIHRLCPTMRPNILLRSNGYYKPPVSNPLYWHRSEEHTSELQSRQYLVCRLLLEKKKKTSQPSSSIKS